MLTSLLKTKDDSASLVLRVMLGVVMFPHGAQKVLGWFGGYGLAGTLALFHRHHGDPAGVRGSGHRRRISRLDRPDRRPVHPAGGIRHRLQMAVAISMVHLPNGFFMNWSGKQAGEGFEFHLLVIAIALALMIKGGGRWSMDRLFKAGRF